VDDDAQVVHTLSDILSRDGYDVLTARDAAQALAVIEKSLPCLLLLDVQMPDMDGLELCRRIRTNPRTSHVPVTFVSVRVDSADVEEGIAAGATDYIKKPFDKDDVRLRVRMQIRMNEVLRAQWEDEEKYRRLVEGLRSEYFVYRHDTNGVFTYVSPSIVYVLGHSPDEFCCHFQAFLTDAPVNQEAADHTARSIQGIQLPPYEVEIRHRDGSVHRLEVLESPALDAAGKVVAVDGIAHDITERRRAEEELMRTREQLHLAVAGSNDGIWDWDLRTQDLYLSPKWKEQLGYADDELPNRFSTFEELIFPEDTAGVFRVVDGYLKGELPKYQMEFRMRHKDGGLRWILARGAALRHSDGTPYRMAGSHTDITDRKRMEAELGHARKLEAVGQLAAGIAHEINTPTQFVGDSIEFLRESQAAIGRLVAAYRQALAELPESPALAAARAHIAGLEAEADIDFVLENAPAAIGDALDGVSRISKIVRAMKEFAHPDQPELAPADLNHALETTLMIARNEYKYVAEVETDFGELPLVDCHLGELNQVFLNLLVNAAHAIGDVVGKTGAKGTIRVCTSCTDEWARIEIADTGGGIPEAAQDHIFEPFFTTKPVGKGSGQGLAIAHAIVVGKHGGQISFETTPGVGTTFSILLPLRSSAPTAGARPSREAT